MNLSPGAPSSESTHRSGWRIVRFGDVVRNVDEAVRDPLSYDLERFVGLEHIDPESLRIKRWGLIAEGTSFTRKFSAGQVLFGKRRAYQRKVAVADFDGLCSSDILVFEPAGDQLLPELLPFIVQTEGFFQHALGTSAGSLSPRTRWRDLAAYEFPLPPLDEQRRIAGILWAGEHAIERDRKLVEELSSFRTLLFEEQLQQVLADRRGGKNTRCEATLGDLLVSSPESGFSAVRAGKDTGHHVLILSALTRQGYQRGHLKPVELVSEVRATVLQEGDFLISRSNTVDLVGLVGIFNESRSDVSFPDTMMRLRLDDSRVDVLFLEQVLLSKTGREQIRRIAAGTSGSMKKINRSGIASLRVPLPALNEQKRIVSLLDVQLQTVSAATKRLMCGVALKQQFLTYFLPRSEV